MEAGRRTAYSIPLSVNEEISFMPETLLTVAYASFAPVKICVDAEPSTVQGLLRRLGRMLQSVEYRQRP